MSSGDVVTFDASISRSSDLAAYIELQAASVAFVARAAALTAAITQSVSLEVDL